MGPAILVELGLVVAGDQPGFAREAPWLRQAVVDYPRVVRRPAFVLPYSCPLVAWPRSEPFVAWRAAP